MCSEVHLGAFAYLSFTVAERPVFLSGLHNVDKFILMPHKLHRDDGDRGTAYGVNTGKKVNVHKVSPYSTKEQP
jgi:hypothetical protein